MQQLEDNILNCLMMVRNFWLGFSCNAQIPEIWYVRTLMYLICNENFSNLVYIETVEFVYLSCLINNIISATYKKKIITDYYYVSRDYYAHIRYWIDTYKNKIDARFSMWLVSLCVNGLAVRNKWKVWQCWTSHFEFIALKTQTIGNV